MQADASGSAAANGSADANVPAATTALASSVPAPLGMPLEPTIVSRAGWGADESLRSGSPLYGEVRCAFVHHTVNGNTYSRSQAPALVRGIYYYHTRVNGWNDIGYNFLIDRFGTIYEGRYGGVAKAVIGAQVLGFNSMSTGVAIIGTFDTVAPSTAALSSLEHLLAWKLDLSHLNPLGTARALCQTTQKYRAGQWVSLPVISGHRQVNYTDCPGTVLFGMLPSIRKAVAGIGDPKIYSPTATPAAFSPNGDGVRDTVQLHAGLSSSDAWTITLSDASGAVVTRFSGTGPAASAVWNGRDAAGERVPDGTYVASFAASDANGTARPAKAAVRIDTVSPQITDLTASPTVISPNGDRFADSAALDFGLSERSGVGLTVLDAKGTVVRTVAAVTEAAGNGRLVWDGKVSSGGALVAAPDGAYQVVLRATDAAGNHSTASVAVTVDDTLGHPRLSPIWISPNGDGVHDAGLLMFRTTRGARLSVAVATSGGAVVRRASLGSLASGAHSWRWDGLNTAGAEGRRHVPLHPVGGKRDRHRRGDAHLARRHGAAERRLAQRTTLDQARQDGARDLPRGRQPEPAGTGRDRRHGERRQGRLVVADREDRDDPGLVVHTQDARYLYGAPEGHRSGGQRTGDASDVRGEGHLGHGGASGGRGAPAGAPRPRARSGGVPPRCHPVFSVGAQQGAAVPAVGHGALGHGWRSQTSQRCSAADTGRS